MHCQSMEVFHNFFEFSDSISEWNVSVKPSTNNTSHLELPNKVKYVLQQRLWQIVFSYLHIQMSEISHNSFGLL